MEQFTDKQVFDELLKRLKLRPFNTVNYSQQLDEGFKNGTVEIVGLHSTQVEVEFKDEDESFIKLKITNYA